VSPNQDARRSSFRLQMKKRRSVSTTRKKSRRRGPKVDAEHEEWLTEPGLPK
jgi:hypothetical protein